MAPGHLVAGGTRLLHSVVEVLLKAVEVVVVGVMVVVVVVVVVVLS